MLFSGAFPKNLLQTWFPVMQYSFWMKSTEIFQWLVPQMDTGWILKEFLGLIFRNRPGGILTEAQERLSERGPQKQQNKKQQQNKTKQTNKQQTNKQKQKNKKILA